MKITSTLAAGALALSTAAAANEAPTSDYLFSAVSVGYETLRGNDWAGESADFSGLGLNYMVFGTDYFVMLETQIGQGDNQYGTGEKSGTELGNTQLAMLKKFPVSSNTPVTNLLAYSTLYRGGKFSSGNMGLNAVGFGFGAEFDLPMEGHSFAVKPHLFTTRMHGKTSDESNAITDAINDAYGLDLAYADKVDTATKVDLAYLINKPTYWAEISLEHMQFQKSGVQSLSLSAFQGFAIDDSGVNWIDLCLSVTRVRGEGLGDGSSWLKSSDDLVVGAPAEGAVGGLDSRVYVKFTRFF